MSRLILIVVATLFVVLVGQRIYFQLQANLISYQQQNLAKKDQDQAHQNYLKLIAEQEKRQKQTSPPPSTDRSIPAALGDYKLLFVLVKPNYLSVDSFAGLLSSLKNPSSEIFNDCNIDASCPKNASLFYIPTFYKQQAKKYGVTQFNPSVEISPMLTLQNLQRVGDVNQFWGKDPFGTTKLQDTFNALLSANNLKVDGHTKVLFLFFDNSYTAPEEDARFYEHKAFRSFAQPETGQAFVDVYSFDSSFAKAVSEIAAHETLHLFGATDKYEENIDKDRICSERGWGDTEKYPSIPQTSSDIMCGYVEYSVSKFKKGNFIDNTLDINKLTAKEIGWVK